MNKKAIILLAVRISLIRPHLVRKATATWSVNTHNAIHWGSQRPTAVVPIIRFPEKVTVWYAISSYGVLGPYFFEENDQNLTVNGRRYHEMLRRKFIPGTFLTSVVSARRCSTTHRLSRATFPPGPISLWRPDYWAAFGPPLASSITRFDCVRFLPLGLRKGWSVQERCALRQDFTEGCCGGYHQQHEPTDVYASMPICSKVPSCPQAEGWTTHRADPLNCK